MKLDLLLDLAAGEQFVSWQGSTHHLCTRGGSCLEVNIWQREEGAAERSPVLADH